MNSLSMILLSKRFFLKTFFVLVIFSLFWIFADKKSTKEKINLHQDYKVILEVKGLVCSFCVAKVRRSLKKLSFVEQKNKKSIVVNIKNQVVLFKVKKNKKIDFKKLKKVINEAGYEILKINFYTDGEIKKDKKHFLVKESKQKIFFKKNINLEKLKKNPQKNFLLEMNNNGEILLVKR